MANVQLEEAKKKYPNVWNRINDEWRESAQKATDSRPDYKWAQEKAEAEFEKFLESVGVSA